MPTLFILFGLTFRIFTRDHFPPHVHVISQDGEAKFAVNHDEVKLIVNKGIKSKDIKLAESILEENKELVVEEWNKLHLNEDN